MTRQLEAGDKIQSGPGHRHTIVVGKPVKGTVGCVRPGGGLVDVTWDAVMLGSKRKELPASVEVVEELELADQAAAARPRTTVAATPGNSPTRDAIEESLTFAASQGLIHSWKRLPVQAQAKWEVVVHPSVHAAEPADVCVIRTYAEAKLFVASLMSARSGIMSRTAPEPVKPRRTMAITRPEYQAKSIDDRLAKMHDEMADTARRDLKRWATVYAQRDDMIRRAASAGVGVNEIARTMGIAKTTVLRVLHPEGGK